MTPEQLTQFVQGLERTAWTLVMIQWTCLGLAFAATGVLWWRERRWLRQEIAELRAIIAGEDGGGAGTRIRAEYERRRAQGRVGAHLRGVLANPLRRVRDVVP